MKLVEITPKVDENLYGYETRRKDITEKFSLDEIRNAIKTSEYQFVSSKEISLNISISKEEWEYINQYARRENISIQLAVQWFWSRGVRLVVGTHKAIQEQRERLGE